MHYELASLRLKTNEVGYGISRDALGEAVFVDYAAV